jgi:predicted RNA-binding protein YlxR (DUF448 family)
MRPKRDLVRVVRTPNGDIQVDATGKVSGRGAYVCPTNECVEAAVSDRRLEHALGVTIPEHSIAALREVANRVPPAPRPDGPRVYVPGRT